MTTAVEQIVEATFEVSEGAELELQNVAGHVTIRTHTEPVISMRARKHGDEGAVANTRIDTDQEGNRVVIQTRQQDAAVSDTVRGNSLSAVDYDVRVPRGCSLNLNTVSAGIDVEGTEGAARLGSVSGNLNLRGAQGEISLSSVSGSITAFALQGGLDASSTSGEVSVLDSKLRQFTLSTVSGSMSVDTPLTPGETYRISTVSGNLKLRVPPGTGASLQLSSISGSVRGEGTFHESSGPGRRNWSGTIGDGGAWIDMSSVSGSMTILTNEAA
jgi:DUF4097 and DUF4098 domain-containing protein YvlB